MKLKTSLYLVEYYTHKPGQQSSGGWEIKFAWVAAIDYSAAKIQVEKLPLFDVIIQITDQAEVTRLTVNDETCISFIGCELGDSI